MRGVARVAVVVLTLLSFTACTSLRPIEDFSPSRIRAQVEAGDDVHIVTRKGATYDLTVTRVESDALTGRAASGKLWKVQYEAIEYIEVAETDLVGTAGGVLMTFYVVVVTVTTIAIIAWVNENDDD